MGLFKALRKVFGVVEKVADVVEEVSPVVNVAEVVVDQVGNAVKPKKGKKKAK